MTRRSTSRRRGYSPEQRAEAARRDAALLDGAAQTLATDRDSVADFTRRAVGGMSPRILGYSLRNQVLLMTQAAARGIDLRDVDTFRGWQRRGRSVRRGEHGLRIIRPVGVDDTNDEPTDGGDPDHGATDDEGRAPRVRFRMTTVFDVSQTDTASPAADRDTDAGECEWCHAPAGEPCESRCACTTCAPPAPTDSDTAPGEVVWNNLYGQITGTGYRFDWPATPDHLHGATVRVDHTTRTVHVALTVTAADPTGLGELAAALADVLTHTDRRTDRPALPAALAT